MQGLRQGLLSWLVLRIFADEMPTPLSPGPANPPPMLPPELPPSPLPAIPPCSPPSCPPPALPPPETPPPMRPPSSPPTVPQPSTPPSLPSPPQSPKPPMVPPLPPLPPSSPPLQPSPSPIPPPGMPPAQPPLIPPPPSISPLLPPPPPLQPLPPSTPPPPPAIVALVADDPDESEPSFAEEDTLSVHFWPPTNAPTELADSDGRLDRYAVDLLLSFSSEIHGDYWAEWNSSTLLVITFGVVDAASAPVPGVFTARCRPGGGIASHDSASRECEGSSPPMVGRWGFSRPPAVGIRSFVAFDPDDGDTECGVGDTLTLTFDGPTDRGRLGRAGPLYGVPLDGDDFELHGDGGNDLVRADGVRAASTAAIRRVSRGALDELLAFEPPAHGLNMSAMWHDDATLVITILDDHERPDAIALGVTRVSVRRRAALRDRAQGGVRVTSTSPALSGTCGRPPLVASFTAAASGHTDAACSDGDVLTLVFDRPTDTPAAQSRVEIDRLLTFSQALGHEYTGAWRDTSTLVITILQGYMPPPELGVATAALRGDQLAGATLLRNNNQRSNPSRAVSPPLSGSCGEPPIVSAIMPRAGPGLGGRPVTVQGRGLLSPTLGTSAVRCRWTRSPLGDQPGPPSPPESVTTNQTCTSAEFEPYAPDVPPPPPPPPFVRVAPVQIPLFASTSKVVCESPPAMSAGSATLRIDRGDDVVLPRVDGGADPGPEQTLTYGFYTPPVVSAIEPLGGPYYGGTPVTFHGSFLDGRHHLRDAGPPLCYFGAKEDTETPVDVHDAAAPLMPMLVAAVWNSSERAICNSPPWSHRHWPHEPTDGRLSALAVGFLPNGADEAIWKPRPDGTAVAPPYWEHLDSKLSALRPLAGPRAVSTALTVLGRGLGVYARELGGMTSMCKVGDAPPASLLAINASAGFVICPVPACLGCPADGAPLGHDTHHPPCCRLLSRQSVSISVNGRDWIGGSPPLYFQYYTSPSISSMGVLPLGSPLSGPPLGGTAITIRGVGFRAVPGVAQSAKCRFGHIVVGAARVSDLGVLCLSPPHLSGAVQVAVSANGVDFLAQAGSASSTGSGLMFQYECTGYLDGPTCVADPNCAWCDDPGVGCMSCPGIGDGAHEGCASIDEGMTFTCSSTTAISACSAAETCSTLSWRHPVITPGGPLRVQVHTELLNRSFAMYRVTPQHTNFALRLGISSPGWARGTRVFARKDLPPTGQPPMGYAMERVARGSERLQLLEIPGADLGCGQRHGRRDQGRWPDLLVQSPQTRWSPIERELVGALYSTTSMWNGNAVHGPEAAYEPASEDKMWQGGVPAGAHCDSWFIGAFGVQPPPPAPYQPSLVNKSLPDDPNVPPPAPPANFHMTILLEPHYSSFGCSDCAPPAAPIVSQFVRAASLAWSSMVPRPLDRYGSEMTGDCIACGMQMRGTAEQVVDEGGQRLRLVHSVAPRAKPQVGSVWYHQKLPVASGFEIRFTVQFQRPSTCAASAVSGENAARLSSKPLWRRRYTGCGLAPDGRPSEGAVGGEGLALVIHNDARGLNAAGCAGAGVGYAADGSYFSTCDLAIQPSIALQLSPYRNVSLLRRMGRHVAVSEPPYLAWDEMDYVGLHLNGDNTNSLASSNFAVTGRLARLTDGQPHSLVLIATGLDVSVYADGDPLPILVERFNLKSSGVFDTSGLSWVGFTAATGPTSVDADLLQFSFCHRPGCFAL